jgi:hypothetical protein
MAIKRSIVNTHNTVENGRTLTVVREAKAEADSISRVVAMATEGALISLFVSHIMGSLTVSVYTYTEPDKRQKLFDFAPITEPTTELLIKATSPIMSYLEFECIHNGACTYEMHVRGIDANQGSTKILAPAALSAKKVIHGTLPAVLIPATFMNRSAVIIKNLSTGTLYLGGSLSEATIATGFPVLAGEAITIDIAGGQAVYAVGTTTGMDIRYMESGE